MFVQKLESEKLILFWATSHSSSIVKNGCVTESFKVAKKELDIKECRNNKYCQCQMEN